MLLVSARIGHLHAQRLKTIQCCLELFICLWKLSLSTWLIRRDITAKEKKIKLCKLGLNPMFKHLEILILNWILKWLNRPSLKLLKVTWKVYQPGGPLRWKSCSLGLFWVFYVVLLSSVIEDWGKIGRSAWRENRCAFNHNELTNAFSTLFACF